MPQWDFECPECGHKATHMFRSFDAIVVPNCDFCGFWYDAEVKMERLPSAPGTFVLKGAGFHKNDYPKSTK